MTHLARETILDLKMPLSERLRIYAVSYGPEDAGEILAVVSGLHGDEYDGLYVIHRLIEVFRRIPPRKRVVLIPAVNPMGLDVSERYWPVTMHDINRRFPGRSDGISADRMAHAVLERAARCKYCVDVHASNVFLLETPQVRLSQEFAAGTLPLAGFLETDLIWVAPSPTVIEATLSYNLNRRGVPTFVIETGVGLRIRRREAERVARGILNLLVRLDAIDPDALDASGVPARGEMPYHATEESVVYLNAKTGGIFVADVEVASMRAAGDEIGRVIEPVEGEVREVVRAPVDGYLFTLRAHPIVYPGSLIGRMIRAGADGSIPRWSAA